MSGRLGVLATLSDAIRSRLGPEQHRRIRRRLLPIYSRIPRIHWSQSGEDVILGELLPEQYGTYVDVGAAHPRLGSNTYFLYRRGWRGTLVEPNPASADRLRKARPRDRVIQAAAGAEDGTASFTMFRSDYLSSIDPEVARERADAGEVVEAVLQVSVVTLASLRLRVSPVEPSLLSIDCEGADFEVLRGNDWGAFVPRVICVEEPASTLTSPTAIRAFLQDHGYALTAHTGLSAVYLHAG